MNNACYAVIMAGGRGERFWPQSRLKHPKHLLPIVGHKPMLCQTLDRLDGLVKPENILIITNTEQADAVREACPLLPPENVIAEPVGRDTAAAVALASLLVQRRNPQAAFAMLPADAVIHDAEGFRSVLAAAFQAAWEDATALVTIGIKPAFPATGYGYLKRGANLGQAAIHNIYQVSQFVEKPDLPTAENYLAQGNYYWNAGMFIWQSAAIVNELKNNAPQLWQAVQMINDDLDAGTPLDQSLAKLYPKLDKISIDYAIMEKARNVRMIESAFDWDDAGEWPAIARHYPQDGAGNTVKGNAFIDDGGTGNIVVNHDGHLTVLIGLHNLVVVQTPDATLICPKEKAQSIKDTVKALASNPDWSKHV